MLDAAALAHTEQTNFCVLDVEGLVGELSVVNRGFLMVSDTAALEEHAWHDSVNLTTFVVHFLVFWCLSVALAESKEIGGGLRSNIAEQLIDNIADFT